MFNDRYTNTLSRDGKGERGRKSCILPFFGFKYDTDEDSYTQGVYISDPDKLSGQSKVYGTHSLKVEVFYRENKPTGDALRLEERFLALEKGKDPWSMPYIPMSLQEFYNPFTASVLGCGMSIILTILWIVLYSFTHPLCIQLFGEEYASAIFLFLAPIVITLASFIFSGIVFLIRKLLGKTTPKFNELSEEELEELRKEYYDRMVKDYGAEAGAILKEYAILMRYDR